MLIFEKVQIQNKYQTKKINEKIIKQNLYSCQNISLSSLRGIGALFIYNLIINCCQF